VLHDFPTWWVMDSGAHWNGPTGLYAKLAQQAFEALRSVRVNVDALAIHQDFSPYRLIVLPVLSTIDDTGAQKLVDYVKKGGTLVWHPLTGIKDPDTRIYPERLHPLLQELLGVEIHEFATLGENETVPFTWNGSTYQGRWFCDLPNISTNLPGPARASGKYQQTWFSGTPAVLKREVGRGRVLYVTTFAEPAFYHDLFDWLCPQAGIEPILEGDIPEGVEVTARSDSSGHRFIFVHNLNSRQKVLKLTRAYEDVYHQEKVGPRVTLPPFGVRILK